MARRTASTPSWGIFGPILVLGWLAGAGCGSPPLHLGLDETSPEPATRSGLHRVGARPFAAGFVRPGATLSGYERALIDRATIEYRDPRRGRQSDPDGSPGLGPEATERLQELLGSALEDAIERADLAPASEPGPRVLRISPHLIDFVVAAPPRVPTRTEVLGNTGAVTVILLLRDSVSGQSLAAFVDRRAIRPEGSLFTAYQNDPVNFWGGVRNVFSIWASQLGDGLAQLRALPEIPSPVASSDPLTERPPPRATHSGSPPTGPRP